MSSATNLMLSPDRSTNATLPNFVGNSHTPNATRTKQRLVSSPLAQQLALVCQKSNLSDSGSTKSPFKLSARDKQTMIKVLPTASPLATSQLFLARREGAQQAKQSHHSNIDRLQTAIDNALKQCTKTGIGVEATVHLKTILAPFYENPDYVYGGGRFTNSFIRDVAIVLGIVEGNAIALDRAIFAHFFYIARRVIRKEQVAFTTDQMFSFAKEAYEKLSKNNAWSNKDINPDNLDTIFENDIKNELELQNKT